MKVGLIGLGKLGLPVAVCLCMKERVEVVAFDHDPQRGLASSEEFAQFARYEAGPVIGAAGHTCADYIKRGYLPRIVGSIAEVVAAADLIFVAVQTPHAIEFEGITPLPKERRDFDYAYLERACQLIADAARQQSKNSITTIAIISTVLPGTIRSKIAPIIEGAGLDIVYNPSFIAMGTTMRDFLNPEFVLIGADYSPAAQKVANFYETIGVGPIRMMSIPEAETVKVTYNTFISLKIAFANIVGEVCAEVGAKSSVVTDALIAASRRLISGYYLRPGMGDGGACHPRDNIAMSWFARKNNLSYDIFEAAMMARQNHAERLAQILLSLAIPHLLPIVIMGYSYKKDVPLVAGSHAILVEELLRRELQDCQADPEKVLSKFDPLIDGGPWPSQPAVFLIGIDHEVFATWSPPAGSIVIDPFDILHGVSIRDGMVVRINTQRR